MATQSAPKIGGLAPDQQTLCRVIYEAFRDSGEWPTYQYVDRKLDRVYNLDVAKVVASVPAGVLRPDPNRAPIPPQPNDRIALTVEGMYRWGGAWGDLDLLLRALRWLVERERNFEPASATVAEELEVTSEEIRRALTVGTSSPAPEDLSRVRVLLSDDQSIYQGMSSSATEWKLVIAPAIRRYRNVYTVEQYIAQKVAAREKLEATSAHLSRRASAETLHVQPCAFLMMPFDPQLDWLRELIALAGQDAGVEVERADDIFAAGVIIDQVKDRIRQADAVIAVCTGKNANVFYELGISEHIHQPILIAERSEDLPFDVHHFRGHFYGGESEFDREDTLRSRVSRALQETLETRPSTTSPHGNT